MFLNNFFIDRLDLEAHERSIACRHVGRGGGGGQGAEAPRKKLNFRKNKPPSPLDSFQSQFIAVLQSTNFFNAKCRLKHPISRNFSGGLRPPSPREGAAPPDPCHSLLAPLAAQLLWTRRLASLAKGPPPKKYPGYVPDSMWMLCLIHNWGCTI